MEDRLREVLETIGGWRAAIGASAEESARTTRGSENDVIRAGGRLIHGATLAALETLTMACNDTLTVEEIGVIENAESLGRMALGVIGEDTQS